MNLSHTLSACALAFTLAACGGVTLYKTETNSWLEQRTGTPDYDISGKWITANSWSGNWGDANFIQDGAKFYGQLGSYTVDGVMNGNQIYLTLTSGKRVYYTGLLKRENDGSYAGKIAEDLIIDSPNAETDGYQVMILERPKQSEQKTGPTPASRPL